VHLVSIDVLLASVIPLPSGVIVAMPLLSAFAIVVVPRIVRILAVVEQGSYDPAVQRDLSAFDYLLSDEL
jgi:hypothetical protein